MTQVVQVTPPTNPAPQPTVPGAAAPPVADWAHPFANGAGSVGQWGAGTILDPAHDGQVVNQAINQAVHDQIKSMWDGLWGNGKAIDPAAWPGNVGIMWGGMDYHGRRATLGILVLLAVLIVWLARHRGAVANVAKVAAVA